VVLNGCSTEVTLELRDASHVAMLAPSPFSIGLSSVPTDLTFYLSPDCGTPVSAVQLDAGSSTASVYFSGSTPGSYTLPATDATFFFKSTAGQTFTLIATLTGVGVDTQSETVIPRARSGSCSIPSTGISAVCTISPPVLDVTKTLLFFQASTAALEPATNGI